MYEKNRAVCIDQSDRTLAAGYRHTSGAGCGYRHVGSGPLDVNAFATGWNRNNALVQVCLQVLGKLSALLSSRLRISRLCWEKILSVLFFTTRRRTFPGADRRHTPGFDGASDRRHE